MSEEPGNARGIDKEQLDYFAVFSYFEGRGARVKSTMFSIVTWLIGFVTIILGFSIKECLDLESSSITVSKEVPLVVLTSIGILIVVYALIVIHHFGGHILRNYRRADLALECRGTPKTIYLSGNEAAKGSPLPTICRLLQAIVLVFGLACGLLFSLGLYTWWRNR